jgi:hypothetical protein
MKHFNETFNAKIKETKKLFQLEQNSSKKNELQKKMIYYIFYLFITDKIITELNNKRKGGRKCYRTMRKRKQMKRFTRRRR